MKNILLILILAVSIGVINISCQNPAQSEYDPSFLKGYIKDAGTSAGIDSVIVSLPDFNLSGVTTSTGYFEFLNIQMPRGQMGTNLITSKNGYNQAVNNIVLNSDDTTKISVVMGLK
jgi:hypothetical protein